MFYSKNALPFKDVWSNKRITQVSGFGRKILVKFELNCPLFQFHIFRNRPIPWTLTDADFPSMNPNNILTLAAYFRENQRDDLSMGAYHVALSFLKDYVAEFSRRDFEVAHLYGTEQFVLKIDFILPEAELLADGPIEEHVLAFVYTTRKTNKKDCFRVLDKHLVPTKALKKFISRASKSDAPEHIKEKFVSQLTWYVEVREWLFRAYTFIKEEMN